MDILQNMLHSPLPSSYHNLEGRVVFCNDINAELLDLRTRDDICHKRVHDLVENQIFATRVEKTILDVIEHKTPQINLYTFKTNQDNIVSWLNVMNPDCDENGSVCGAHGFSIPLAKNNRCFINHALSETGLPMHALSLVTIDSDFQHPYLKILTKQEQKVLMLLLQGYSCKRISHRLVVSPRTIETHISHIKNKYMVNTRDALIDFCYESGLARILSFLN